MSVPAAIPPARHGRDLDLVSMGLAAVDHIMPLGRPVERGGKNLARSYIVSPGGQAATAAAACAVLGGRAAFAGRVGAGGGIVLDALRLRGVDVADVVEVPGPTQTALVLVDPNGERTIGWIRPEGVRIPPAEVPRQTIARAAILLLDGHQGEADIEAARAARSAGTRIVLDLEDATPWTKDLLRLADVAICDSRFLARFAGEAPSPRALERILEAGPPVAAATLGARGAIGATANWAFEVPAPSIEARDTTGAGDVFHGAFSLAAARGLPPDDALAFAASAAALSTRGVGAMGALPSWGEAAAAAGAPRPLGAPAAAAPAPPALAPGRPRRPRVLLVDDNLIVHHTLGRILAARGYEVVSAKTGAEAITRFSEARPDVVIMDVKLPDSSGLAAIEALKARVANCPPILVHTGYADEFTAEHAAGRGADAYLAKPAAPNDVIRAIERLLER